MIKCHKIKPKKKIKNKYFYEAQAKKNLLDPSAVVEENRKKREFYARYVESRNRNSNAT